MVILLRCALLLACVAVVICLAVWSLQRRVVFPGAGRDDSAVQLPIGAERLWLSSSEARVEAWLLPGAGRGDDSPGPVVIYAHGNGETIDTIHRLLDPYRAQGISIALLEYRGYGRSTGEPSEAGIIGDARQLYEAVLTKPWVDPDRVLLHGRSLGGGVVCGLLARGRFAALILESTFSSLADRAQEMGVPSFLVRDRFPNLSRIKGASVPMLILHGTEDQVIPIHHAETLASAVGHAKLRRFQAGHNDLLAKPDQYWEEIGAFLTANGLMPLAE